MRSLEILSRTSAFLLESQSSIFNHEFHVVTASHSVSPWKFPKLYTQEWLTYINENHASYSFDIRDSEGKLHDSFPLLRRTYSHASRDLAVLHLEDEISFKRLLDSYSHIINLDGKKHPANRVLNILKPHNEIASSTDVLMFMGHDVIKKENAAEDDDERLCIPRAVIGSLNVRTSHQVFCNTGLPALAEGMCGGAVLKIPSSTIARLISSRAMQKYDGDITKGDVSKLIFDSEDSTCWNELLTSSKLIGMIEGIVSADASRNDVANNAVYVECSDILSFLNQIEQSKAKFVEPTKDQLFKLPEIRTSEENNTSTNKTVGNNISVASSILVEDDEEEEEEAKVIDLTSVALDHKAVDDTITPARETESNSSPAEVAGFDKSVFARNFTRGSHAPPTGQTVDKVRLLNSLPEDVRKATIYVKQVKQEAVEVSMELFNFLNLDQRATIKRMIERVKSSQQEEVERLLTSDIQGLERPEANYIVYNQLPNKSLFIVNFLLERYFGTKELSPIVLNESISEFERKISDHADTKYDIETSKDEKSKEDKFDNRQIILLDSCLNELEFHLNLIKSKSELSERHAKTILFHLRLINKGTDEELKYSDLRMSMADAEFLVAKARDADMLPPEYSTKKVVQEVPLLKLFDQGPAHSGSTSYDDGSLKNQVPKLPSIEERLKDRDDTMKIKKEIAMTDANLAKAKVTPMARKNR